jgi:hypothetical protein
MPSLTAEEDILFQKLEEEIPLNLLLDYREYSFIEIRMEA